MRTKRLLLFAGFAGIFMLIGAAAVSSNAQTQAKRDYLTPAEIEIVSDAQQIDLRIAVFIKIIERRLAVLDGSAVDPAKTGKLPKNGPDWGELRTGTPLQLYRDIEGLVDKAINDIDDVAVREPESKLMMRAAKTLGEACKTFLPKLKAFDAKTTDKVEKIALGSAIEYAQSVIDSMSKVPANIDEPEPKEKKDKSKKPG